MTGSPALAARLAGVSHRYRRAVALEGIDLELPAGELIGFVGPDGVGKSTLLALVAGARRIQQGRVEVLGGDMRRATHRREVCRRIAYMPQGLGRNLYPTLSIRENLGFFARLFGQGREDRAARIPALLAATGLAPFARRPVAQLSGGMKQKLGLCCALLHDPDVLILDEPTTGVDPLSRRHFWEIIAELRAQRPGMTVLVSTAYFDEAERFDRLVAMHGARILAEGTPAAIKARTGEPTLEHAFVSLLPAHIREAHRELPPHEPPPDDPEVAIDADGLTRRFGDFTAVEDVSFTIHRGEVFGFIGSNGCGKTTTMKMLAGLLPPTAGTAALFGHTVDARDVGTRRRVGFMSQSFSLYTELTVRQNLVLHARLFHLPRATAQARIAALVERFGLAAHLDQPAESVPLGVRQRLSLAVAVIHEPEVLILDEPTSGVDPVARDEFWALLSDLSRRQGVTIFLSTHFMAEAERCDRVALMHAGRVLAQGTPQRIAADAGAPDLEEAFVAHLSAGEDAGEKAHLARPPPAAASRSPLFSVKRTLAQSYRESLEIARDPMRLVFAILGPVLLMFVFGLGVTFDIERVAFAVLDADNTAESRAYLENYTESRYFEQHAAPRDASQMEQRLRSGELRFAVEVPPGFGRDMRAGRVPQVLVQVDGAFPFRAQSVAAYVEGAHGAFVQRLLRERGVERLPAPADLEMRFRYNQDIRSMFAVVPGIIMIILMLIPAVTTAMGVVREKELGSITNLYVTPTTGIEFLLGKQLPYVAIALVNFAVLLLLTVVFFHVPLKGSAAALTAGAVLYVMAATAFGLVVSSFVRTQIAAMFAAAILASLPTVQYSGFMLPVASMSPDAQFIARIFPPMYFEHVSVGTFTKALGLADVATDLAALAIITVAFLALARALLRTQER
ncbi:MAG TPA: ribosome-associated ATPase/putative transporter RbbA [Usitatibacter sp.]|nr:ribosome-associated ATPase/putative transporter RbbA [Usitatibacter sp.]